jgi:hypothetical protein
MRGHFRDYLDSRLAVYDRLPDLNAANRESSTTALNGPHHLAMICQSDAAHLG